MLMLDEFALGYGRCRLRRGLFPRDSRRKRSDVPVGRDGVLRKQSAKTKPLSMVAYGD